MPKFLEVTDKQAARDVLSAASDFDFRLDDTRTPTDGSVTLSKLDPLISTYLDGIQSPNLAINNVGMVNAASISDATQKNTAVGVFHYNRTLQPPFYGVRMESASAFNALQLGGGYSAGTAATIIQFFAADDNVTTTGSLVGIFTSDGLTVGDDEREQEITLALDSADGYARSVTFSSGAVARWILGADSSAETGSDAGSNFRILSRDDAGDPKTTILSINRATDVTTFGGKVVLPASTNTQSSLRIPHGTAPSSPGDGDVWTTTSGMFSRINGVTERVPLFNESESSDLSSGESSLSRYSVTGMGATGNQSLRLTYFTAKKTETITELRVTSGSTAAVGATLCRIGIYEEDSSTGDLTLVAATANDTTLFSASSTVYEPALAASLAKVRGKRYAVGVLVVGTSTAPNIVGHAALPAAEAGRAPRLGGLVGSQTDLPNTVSAASINSQSNLHYVALVP